MSSGSGLVRALQERAARALPAEHLQRSGGWWLRHVAGGPWWVGSVLPHQDTGGLPLAHRVADAEAFYATHDAPARFQITPQACAPELDSFLAERGYRQHTPVSLRVAPIGRVTAARPPSPAGVVVANHPTTAWCDAWQAVTGEDRHPERALLHRMEQPCGYARAMVHGQVAAVGRAVADTGWAGVFGMVTLPQLRGHGAARSVLAALAHWAEAHHADQLYLQVEQHNTPALRLYDGAGFAQLCTYHYRSAE